MSVEQFFNEAGSTKGSLGPQSLDDIYSPVLQNWYKALPYGFSFFNRQEKSKSTSIFYLPILPSNINVTTHFATNIVTTLFGIVEEHSEVRYYDIEIAGTTGIAPRYIDAKQQGNKPSSVTSSGRAATQVAKVELGGFLPEVTNTLNQVKGLADDIFGGQPKNVSGVDITKTGYLAFHNFYRFLLSYKKDAAGGSNLGGTKRKHHPLQFLNYKDRVKYDCAIQSFTLTRSAASPMLYNYNIKMRAYNIRSVDASPPEQDQLTKLGLGKIEGQSLMGTITGKVGAAATLIGAIL